MAEIKDMVRQLGKLSGERARVMIEDPEHPGMSLSIVGVIGRVDTPQADPTLVMRVGRTKENVKVADIYQVSLFGPARIERSRS
jgi:hypothetical protein